MILHAKISHIICFLFVIIITSSLHGMEEQEKLETDPTSFNNTIFINECTTLESIFRNAIFEHLSLPHNIIDEIDEDKIALFKKKYLKDNGFQKIFSDNAELTLKYLNEVWEKTKAPKTTSRLAGILVQHSPLNLTFEDIKELFKNYFIELYFQKFFVPTKERLMNSCNCAKAPLASKLRCMVQTVNNLSILFPPDQCTPSSPLVGTFFGAGRAMNEYLLMHALAKRYTYASIQFIDKTYQTNQSLVNLFKTMNEQLQHAGCLPQLSIFHSTANFKHFIDIVKPLKHNFIISIDPGNKKKIKDHKAPRRAHLVTISLKNTIFNQQHSISMKLKDPKNIKAKSWNLIIDCFSVIHAQTATMDDQISKLHKKLTDHFMSKQHESRAAFVIGLQEFIAKKKMKIQKKSEQNCYNDMNIEWYKKPSIDFQDFAKQHMQPTTICLMVHNGMQEITLYCNRNYF